MNRCADRVVLRAALAALVALSLSGCAAVFQSDPPAAPAKPAPARPKPADKGDPNKRFAEALALHKGNQVGEAEAAYLALTQDFPQYSGPWTNLGIVYAKSNRRPQAVSALSRAVTANATNYVAYNWLGLLYREGNDLPRARAAYDKALALKPDYALAHYNLAILLDAHLKRPLEALPHYREYQRLSGRQDLKVLAWIAEIEAATGVKAADAPAAPAPAAPVPEAEKPAPRYGTFAPEETK